MIDAPILQDLGVMILAATAMVLLARLIRIPAIVAYILAGLVVGPGLALVELGEGVEVLSEAGIALLLFIVGLELSISKIREVGKVAVVAGLGQVGFTALGGFLLCWALGFTAIEGLFIATALTFSSTVVVVKLLDQKSEIDSVYGRIAVGIFLVQDLVVIVALTFLAGLREPETMTAAEMAMGVLRAFGGMGLLLVLAFLCARWVLPRAFAAVARSPETTFIWALTWCFLLVLGAEFLELSLEIGAFLAGVSLAQLPRHSDLKRRTHPLMNFLIAVFFVSLGAQMDFGAAAQVWGPAVVLSLFVLVGNPFIFLWIIARMGYGERTAFLTSVTVAQISEFSFIFAAMGLSAGLIGPEVLGLVAIVGFVTIALSAYMILYNHELYGLLRGRWILRLFRAPQEGLERSGGAGPAPLRDHAIVVGLNSLGRGIVEALVRKGETVLAVDTDPDKLAGLPCRTLLGNVEHPVVLEEAGLERARLLVSALQIEDVNRLLAHRARSAGAAAVIHVQDEFMERELEELGARHLINPRHAGVQRIVEGLRVEGVFSE